MRRAGHSAGLDSPHIPAGDEVSYLAVAADTVGQHIDVLRSKSVGMIGATVDSVTQWSSPQTSEAHEQVVVEAGRKARIY